MRERRRKKEEQGEKDGREKDGSGEIDAIEEGGEVQMIRENGMTKRTLELGEEYHCQCKKT